MEKLSRGKRIAICAGIGVLAFGLVLGGLLLTREKLDYADARADTEKILATRDAVSTVIESEEEITDEEQKNFEEAFSQAAEAMEILNQRTALKDKEVAVIFEKVQTKFAQLQRVVKAEQVLKGALRQEELSDEALAELETLDINVINEMLKELEEYKKEAAEFIQQHSEVTDEDELIEAYGNFQIKGEELTDKYTDVGFDKIFGVSRTEIISFYDSVEELYETLGARL